jgi:hypothetical protein
MTQSPVVEFGLSVLAAAYSARQGQCDLSCQIRLLSTALRCVPEDVAARAMVLDFTASVRASSRAAGEALADAVYAWLDSLPINARYDIEKSANPGSLYHALDQQYEWQRRADLQ